MDKFLFIVTNIFLLNIAGEWSELAINKVRKPSKVCSVIDGHVVFG